MPSYYGFVLNTVGFLVTGISTVNLIKDLNKHQKSPTNRIFLVVIWKFALSCLFQHVGSTRHFLHFFKTNLSWALVCSPQNPTHCFKFYLAVPYLQLVCYFLLVFSKRLLHNNFSNKYLSRYNSDSQCQHTATIQWTINATTTGRDHVSCVNLTIVINWSMFQTEHDPHSYNLVNYQSHYHWARSL